MEDVIGGRPAFGLHWEIANGALAAELSQPVRGRRRTAPEAVGIRLHEASLNGKDGGQHFG